MKLAISKIMMCEKRTMIVQAITATTAPAMMVRKTCSRRFRPRRSIAFARGGGCVWGAFMDTATFKR